MSGPMDLLLGKKTIDEVLEFEEVGMIRYSNHLEGYVITIGETDYFFSAVPKEDKTAEVFSLRQVEDQMTSTNPA